MPGFPGQLRCPGRDRKHQLTRSDLGRQAEAAVADLLFAKGYTLLGRNVRLGPLELDIVARKGSLAVVVEVRTRGASSWAGAFQSITRAKRERLRRATQRLWRARLRALQGIERLRIDAAAVSFVGSRTLVEYVAGAVG